MNDVVQRARALRRQVEDVGVVDDVVGDRQLLDFGKVDALQAVAPVEVRVRVNELVLVHVALVLVDERRDFLEAVVELLEQVAGLELLFALRAPGALLRNKLQQLRAGGLELDFDGVDVLLDDLRLEVLRVHLQHLLLLEDVHQLLDQVSLEQVDDFVDALDGELGFVVNAFDVGHHRVDRLHQLLLGGRGQHVVDLHLLDFAQEVVHLLFLLLQVRLRLVQLLHVCPLQHVQRQSHFERHKLLVQLLERHGVAAPQVDFLGQRLGLVVLVDLLDFGAHEHFPLPLAAHPPF